jgi:hypothetical protein
MLTGGLSPEGHGQSMTDTGTRTRSAQIVFLLDVSNSMARDNKMKLLKNSTGELLKLLSKNDLISLMTFGDQINLLYHTTSYPGPDSLLKLIPRIRSTASATNINGGIADAYELIKTTVKSSGKKPKRMSSKQMRNGYPTDYLARENHVLLVTDGLFELNEYSKQLVCDHPDIRLTCVIVGKGREAEEAVTYVKEELQLKVITLIDEEKDVKNLTGIFSGK